MLYWTLPINGHAVYPCGKKLCQCASIPDNLLPTQLRKENVGLRVTQMWWLGCCFSLHLLEPIVPRRSPTTLATALRRMWLMCFAKLWDAAKILAFWNLLIKVALLGGINPTQKCGGAHKHQTYSYLFLITYVFKHAKLSVLLFPFQCIYLKIWLSIRKGK